MKPGDNIPYTPKIDFKSKGETSIGATTIGELLAYAQQWKQLQFTDKEGNLYELNMIEKTT